MRGLIESKIVLNINQGDMEIMALDLSEREIISITYIISTENVKAANKITDLIYSKSKTKLGVDMVTSYNMVLGHNLKRRKISRTLAQGLPLA